MANVIEQWGRTSTDSCLPVNLQYQNYCDCRKADMVTLGKGFLTAEMVDTLDATRQNWIIELDSEQILDLQGGDTQQVQFKQALFQKQMAGDLVAAVPLALYQALEVNGAIYWFAMFSCWVGGWGKVRLLVSCKNPVCKETRLLLVTNRLEWSPSRILRLYSQANLKENNHAELAFPGHESAFSSK